MLVLLRPPRGFGRPRVVIGGSFGADEEDCAWLIRAYGRNICVPTRQTCRPLTSFPRALRTYEIVLNDNPYIRLLLPYSINWVLARLCHKIYLPLYSPSRLSIAPISSPCVLSVCLVWAMCDLCSAFWYLGIIEKDQLTPLTGICILVELSINFQGGSHSRESHGWATFSKYHGAFTPSIALKPGSTT